MMNMTEHEQGNWQKKFVLQYQETSSCKKKKKTFKNVHCYFSKEEKWCLMLLDVGSFHYHRKVVRKNYTKTKKNRKIKTQSTTSSSDSYQVSNIFHLYWMYFQIQITYKTILHQD